MKFLEKFRLVFFILMNKGGEGMDVIYAALIIRELKTFKDVPNILKAKVKVVLEGLGLGELAVIE